MAIENGAVDQRSWWRKTFGRSPIKAVVGDFFDRERNAASIIAIGIVGTLCYAAISLGKDSALDTLSKLIFAVVGYYFGAKSGRADDNEDGGV